MKRCLVAAAALLLTFGGSPANAQAKLKVIASFSILGDLVRNVGGDRTVVETLVGPNGNSHIYVPSPSDAKKVADADVVVVNGLGLEGWLDRLVKASGTRAPIVVATDGIKARGPGADDDHEHDHGRFDPHAWQSVPNAKIMVTNIREALIAADPANKGVYTSNATAYLAKLDGLDHEVRDVIAKIPHDRRRVITSHSAFGYFADTYGVEFTAPQGVSTDAEASAKDIASIIAQIKKQKISAVFLENVTDPRPMKQIASETGAKIGGTLYSDALTDDNGDAATYIELIRHNLKQLATALTS